MYAASPVHLWNANTLTLGIGVHALNKLMTTCTSTFAPSSTCKGCTIDAKNSCLIVGLHMDVSVAYAALVYLEGWMEWLDPESGFFTFVRAWAEVREVRGSTRGELEIAMCHRVGWTTTMAPSMAPTCTQSSDSLLCQLARSFHIYFHISFQ